MSRYATLADFVAKINWEGGVLEAMQYGLTEDDIPDDGSGKSRMLYRLWAEVRAILPLIDQIDELLYEES